jgi:nucleotide-binding universal stress UspA family protein
MQPYMFNSDIIKQIETDAKKRFDEMCALHAKNARTVHFMVMNGSVSHCVGEAIVTKKSDLVIMGTHGASGLREYFIGSNTEKVVRISPVPVISLKKSLEVKSIKNIVLPTSLQLDQANFMKQVKNYQQLFKATLQLLYVNTPAYFRTDNQTSFALDKFVKHYNLHDYTLNIRNDIDEQQGILSFADQIKADMIMMATHSRRGVAHLFAGSIAEDVVNHLNCPIWTYTLGNK